MDGLSTELVALILLQLREIHAPSLAAVRLVSRRLYDITTPIRYERLRLTERIVSPESEVHMAHGLRHVLAFTRHVEVLEDLDPENVRRVLNGMNSLKSVRWKYHAPRLCSGGYWLPSDVLKPPAQSIYRQRVRLAIEDLPLEDYTGQNQDAYLQAIPAPLLVSLKAETRFPLRTPQLDSLKSLLIKSRGLETFHYNDNGQGTRFAFRSGERLPPIQELELRSYDWNHTSAEAGAHWDFSRLRTLVLVDVPLNQFLSTVPASALSQITSLECGDFNPGSPAVRRTATALLASLINQIEELQELKITCQTSELPVSVLTAHGQTLRSLRFRDHVGFAEDDIWCPTMAIDDLMSLSQRMPVLESLEVDLEVRQYHGYPSKFLSGLCRFPQLKRLTLHVQTLVNPFDEDVDMDNDKDMEAAEDMCNYLVVEKARQHQQNGRSGIPGWDQITINVGGWGPVQVRRLSEAWRERNEQGIFAERCFVFERQPLNSDAEYEMYERANIRD
ncbi:F-box domain-containing protein [Microdochium trichocladiopsis]|uniref:F-box domain-containing protein n=1 Tax=Microdochium trichocladiopsis TaxID=1682393 RepID=A0A9P8XUS0_9PEZI|nr:F-box domain-containing protein [Microdochium trichocladiopsis]KAH7018281.1 F-box domain-containing protein [Microdochium trichocladiopsis]